MDIAVHFVIIIATSITTFVIGIKAGKKVKVEACQQLRCKFRADLKTLEHDLNILNNNKRCHVYNSLDSEIMKVRLIVKGLDVFSNNK